MYFLVKVVEGHAIIQQMKESNLNSLTLTLTLSPKR